MNGEDTTIATLDANINENKDEDEINACNTEEELDFEAVEAIYESEENVPVSDEIESAEVEQELNNTCQEAVPGPDCIACPPCNLVFKSKDWMEKHVKGKDHIHVVEGFKPRGGKFLCFLCWAGYEENGLLDSHLRTDSHLSRCVRKGVFCLLKLPLSSGPDPPWLQDILSRSPKIIVDKTKRPPKMELPKSNTWSSRPESTSWTAKVQAMSHNHRETHKSDISQSHVLHQKSNKSKERRFRRVWLADYFEKSSVGECDLPTDYIPRLLESQTSGIPSSNSNQTCTKLLKSLEPASQEVISSGNAAEEIEELNLNKPIPFSSHEIVVREIEEVPSKIQKIQADIEDLNNIQADINCDQNPEPVAVAEIFDQGSLQL